jgi:nitrogen fixation NifU-like protein
MDEGVVKDVSFVGTGCAISKASASMMTQALKGKSREEAQTLFGEFHRMVTGELDEESTPNGLGRLKIFSGVRDYPARVKCASLSWHTMHAALEGQDMATTENLGPELSASEVS